MSTFRILDPTGVDLTQLDAERLELKDGVVQFFAGSRIVGVAKDWAIIVREHEDTPEPASAPLGHLAGLSADLDIRWASPTTGEQMTVEQAVTAIESGLFVVIGLASAWEQGPSTFSARDVPAEPDVAAPPPPDPPADDGPPAKKETRAEKAKRERKEKAAAEPVKDDTDELVQAAKDHDAAGGHRNGEDEDGPIPGDHEDDIRAGNIPPDETSEPDAPGVSTDPAPDQEQADVDATPTDEPPEPGSTEADDPSAGEGGDSVPTTDEEPGVQLSRIYKRLAKQPILTDFVNWCTAQNPPVPASLSRMTDDDKTAALAWFAERGEMP